MSFSPWYQTPQRTIWNDPAAPAPDMADVATDTNPASQARNIFAQLGLSTSNQNPFLQHFQRNLAPAMNFLWETRRNPAGGDAGGNEGMTDWMRGLAGAITGSGGRSGSWDAMRQAGLPVGRNAFASAISSLMNGETAQQGLGEMFAGADNDDQAREFARLIDSLGSFGGMTAMQRKAAQMALKNLQGDFEDMIASGHGTTTNNFMDFLGRSGFMQRFINPNFVYNAATGLGRGRVPLSGGAVAQAPAGGSASGYLN